jgi:Flp pilus assembly pilin Flp
MNTHRVVGLSLWGHFRALRDSCRGQDLIEYALMAALVATGIVTMSPQVAEGFVTIISRVNSVVVVAGAS